MVKGDNSTKKEKKKGAFSNIIEVIKMVNGFEPRLPIFLSIAICVPIFICITLAIVLKIWPLGAIGIFIGLLSFLITLNKVADKVSFEQIDGKPGASGAILKNVKLGNMSFDEEPVAINAKTKDLVFRGVGRAGVVFVTEGPTNRVKTLLDKEVNKTKRILPNVPITIVNCGNNEGQTPLKKLKWKVSKIKISLTKSEYLEVQNRLRALGTWKMPIPKGIDPTKMKSSSRRNLRGK